MSTDNITITKNYSLFSYTKFNRPINITKRKNLRKSMQKYGYIKAYPLLCIRTDNGLEVHDGQHRLEIAKELGLPVAYIVHDTFIDIPKINQTPIRWQLADYAGAFAAQGKKDYLLLFDFMNRYQLPITIAIEILLNNPCTGASFKKFKDGNFKINSIEAANRIAVLYSEITQHNSCLKRISFGSALVAVCLIDPPIDAKRLVAGIKRCPEKVIIYATRDGFIGMLEDAYNFGKGMHKKLNLVWLAKQKIADFCKE